MNPADPMFWRNFATVFFFLFFCGVIVWAFRSRRARDFPRESALPLDEGHALHPETASRHD